MTTDEAVMALLTLIDSDLARPPVEPEEAWKALERFAVIEHMLSSGEAVVLGVARTIHNPYTPTAGLAGLGACDINRRRKVLSIVCSYFLGEKVTL